MSEQELTAKMVKKYQQAFRARQDAAVIARAIQKNGIKNASEDPAASERLHRAFSYEIKTGKPSNQRHSGRCSGTSLQASTTLRTLNSPKTTSFSGTGLNGPICSSKR